MRNHNCNFDEWSDFIENNLDHGVDGIERMNYLLRLKGCFENSMNSIIVEGIDGTGKSTLVNELCIELDFSSIKYKEHPKTIPDLNSRISRSIIAMIEGSTIQDRSPLISDLMYSKYNRTLYPSYDWQKSKTILDKLNPIIIFCDTSIPIHHISKYEDKDMIELISCNTRNIRQAYYRFFSYLDVEIYRYDYTQKGAYKELLSKIGGKNA